MRMQFAGAFVILFALGATVAAAEEEGGGYHSGWHVQTTEGGTRMFAAAVPDKSGWGMLLTCGKSGALEATLMNLDPHYLYDVAGVKAKASPGDPAVDLQIERMVMKSMVKLKGLDAMEKKLLQSEHMMVRVTLPGTEDFTGNFAFPGIRDGANLVLQRCPPF
jgi:hypothetical protein